MTMNNKKKAFTLIELLVVIAIIALLVSILLPSLRNATELAREATCLSQIKSMGSAFGMYASEYDDVIPPYHDGKATALPPDRHGWYYSWRWMISPFIGENAAMFFCPSDNETRTYSFKTSKGLNCTELSEYAMGSYGENGYVIPITGWGGFPQTPKLSSINNPGAKLIVTDAWGDCAVWPVSHEVYPYESSYSDRHRNGLSALYLDFHAERKSPQNINDWADETVMTGGSPYSWTAPAEWRIDQN